MRNYFSIDGYWKDDESIFHDYIVKDTIDVDDDDEEVFYFGLTEQDILNAISNPHDSGLEFVITNYQHIKY